MPLNPTLIAARHAGRPVLMRPTELAGFARRLAAHVPGDREPGGWTSLLPFARRSAEREDPPRPKALIPRFLGGADYTAPAWALKSGVAFITISGPLMDGDGWCWGEWINGYDAIRCAIEEAQADDRVQGLFITHDSPGGVVAPGLIDLAAHIRETNRAAGGKPIHGFCPLSASADYWFAAQSDHLSAPSVGMVGSIGCYTTHCDISGALEQSGIVVTEIQFGEQKTWGSPFKALAPDALAAIQSEVDEIGEAFVGDLVLSPRGLSRQQVLDTQAGCFLARNRDSTNSAIDLGLIDAIQTEREAVAAMFEAIKSTPSSQPAPGPLAEAIQEPIPMSDPKTPAAQAEQTRKAAALAKANADLKAAQAAVEALKAEDIAAVESEPATPAADAADDKEDQQDGGADEGAEGEPDETGKKKPAAEAIASSPEAAAHPKLALAAITSGQTLAQFKATVAAVGGEAAKPAGALREAMAGAPRLGADAPATTQKAATAAETYAKNRTAGLAARGK